LAWALLALLALSLSPRAQAASPSLARSPLGEPALDDVLYSADGSFSLSLDAPPPPALLGPYLRHGVALADPIALSAPTHRLALNFAADLPNGSALRVDLRGSADGSAWMPWAVNLPAGSVVAFPRPIVRAQYRLTLLGGRDAGPSVRVVTLAPSTAPATAAAPPGAAPYDVAPTFRIRATRQGMIGGRTANGYIIPPQARFVSLPSWSVLSSRGGDEYKVRISYRGRSTVVPVYDVGPYSGRDDYWDVKRDGYPDLERGWPMDHAAYYEGYNGRRADKGYVRFPTAMDVGDGAWINDLGIVGDQAEVEVTYLWLGQDPLAGPPVRDQAAAEHSVDELGGDFWHSPAALGVSAVGCGQARHAYWTTSTSDPAQSVNIVRWQPALPVAGAYDVYAHVPVCPSKRPPVTQARYVVQHQAGAVEVAVDQSTQMGWVHLGRYSFDAGPVGFVQLADLANEPGRTVWFDQVKWVRAP
jgi:hypothetical protein